MIDCEFPIIRYSANQSPLDRGRMHGESYREAIVELFEIRLGLMRNLNPDWTAEQIERLAAEQWQSTHLYDAELTAELQGICDGSGLSQEQLMVLNNYTDFRDIPLPDEGCSAAYVRYDGRAISGQTWDMHGSAKNYVCCIEISDADGAPSQVLFSLVGWCWDDGLYDARHDDRNQQHQHRWRRSRSCLARRGPTHSDG